VDPRLSEKRTIEPLIQCLYEFTVHSQSHIVLMQDKHHVCTKMFGGGMGDQIKRYCELLNPEVLYSKPWMKERMERIRPATSGLYIVHTVYHD